MQKKFPNGKTRAITFSYDDGISQDMRLVQLFNLYGMKGTFNLNSGIQQDTKGRVDRDVFIRRMPPDVLPALYQGHEVAVHTLTHPHLYDLPGDQLAYELRQDKENLQAQFKQPIVGMALSLWRLRCAHHAGGQRPRHALRAKRRNHRYL